MSYGGAAFLPKMTHVTGSCISLQVSLSIQHNTSHFMLVMLFRQHIKLTLSGVPHTARDVKLGGLRNQKLGTICIPYHAAAVVEPAHMTAHRDNADTADSTNAVRAAGTATSYGSSCSPFCVSLYVKVHLKLATKIVHLSVMLCGTKY